MNNNKLVSPTECLYHRANHKYEVKNFDEAIALYKQFLDQAPNSTLTTPAELNLGMSYYYSGDYPQAYKTLKAIDLEDLSLKEYVDGILKDCEAKAGVEIKAAEQAQLAAASGQTPGGQIQIEVTDAYLDDFGSLVLTGKTNRILTVFVENKKVALDGNNMFTTSVSWIKGKPVILTATDDAGISKSIDFYADSESPLEPRGLRIINTSENSASIEWDQNTESDIKGYRLFYRLKGGSTREVPGIIEDTQDEIVGLQAYEEGANKTFEFYVRAIDKMNNESPDSDTLEVTLP